MIEPTAIRPKRAMILAAGLGKRMRPLTATVPKPLIEVGGRALIDHSLDRLQRAGVETAVVNVHYLPDLMRVHLRRWTKPSVKVRDICQFGPRPVRNRKAATTMAETLAEHGWLTPLNTHRYDKREWKIVRGPSSG